MDFPIPTHLQPFFAPIGKDNSEFKAVGTICCACGGNTFAVWESNDRQIIKLVCMQCGKEILLFDAGQHGWEGFVCKDDFLDREAPFQKYRCLDCDAEAFDVTVRITSQGRRDFAEECVANDDSFTLEDWVDGFEWINVSLRCPKCGKEERDWLDLETM